jgi:hypothetical protein
MRRPSLYNLNSLISEPSGEVKSLLDQLSKINQLNQLVTGLLNKSLAKHCRVINLRQNILVIATDSPLWLNKIRFQLPDLIEEIRNQGYVGLVNIEVIVKPDLHNQPND